MLHSIRTFATSQSGAVTVDWVVLTAAIIGLGVAVMASVGKGTTALSSKIAEDLASTKIATY
jgi:hypothetical protein